MLQEAQCLTKTPSISENDTLIQTTLYDLIKVVNETVRPGEEKLASAIVTDLLDLGHARFQKTYHLDMEKI